MAATSRPAIGTQLDASMLQTNKDYTIPATPAAIVARRIASGQITITDLNDGKAVQAYTSSLLGDTQAYSPETKVYTPDYTYVDNSSVAHPQVITAKVFVTGNSIDQAPKPSCANWSWTVDGTTVPSGGLDGGAITAGAHQLTIKKNIDKSKKRMVVGWECDFTDPETKSITHVSGEKTIGLMESAGAVAMVIIEMPSGDTFDDANGLITLPLLARLYRGSTVDTTVSAASWERLDITDGTWKTVITTGTNADVVTPLDSAGLSKIVVHRDNVQNFQSYRCKMTDTESGDVFYGMTTLLDATDPYVAELYTLTGNTIKNGATDTTIYARVWRNGEVVEDGEAKKFDYGWSKFDKNGTATAWHDKTSTINNGVTKFGNPVVLSHLDVNMKTTVYCNVVKK